MVGFQLHISLPRFRKDCPASFLGAVTSERENSVVLLQLLNEMLLLQAGRMISIVMALNPEDSPFILSLALVTISLAVISF